MMFATARILGTCLACTIAVGASTTVAHAQEHRLTVYEPLSGPDSLHVLPENGPRAKRPFINVRHPIASGIRVPKEGLVIAAYIVSANGTVVPGSVSILESSHSKFTAAVCSIVHQQKFEPYIHDGRARRALVLWPISFSVDSRPQPPDLEKWRTLPPIQLVELVSKAPRCPRP